MQCLEERGHRNHLDNLGVQEGDVGWGASAPEEVQVGGPVLAHAGAAVHRAVHDGHGEGADRHGASGREGTSGAPLPGAGRGLVQVDVGVDPDAGREVGGVRCGEPHGGDLG